MFENLISKILRIERESIPNRQEIVIAPDVISAPVPEKYGKDIEALRKKNGDAFKTCLRINFTFKRFYQSC